MNSIFQKQESPVPQVMSIFYYELPYAEGVKYFGKPHNLEKYNNGKIHQVSWRFKFYNGENIRIRYDISAEFNKWAMKNNVKTGVVPGIDNAETMEIVGSSSVVQLTIMPILDAIIKKKFTEETYDIIEEIFE